MAFLDNINKFKRIRTNYNFVDTLIDGAFNIASAPLPTLKWIVVQTIFNLILGSGKEDLSALYQGDGKLPNVIDKTTPAKVVFQSLLTSATQEGKDYVKKVQKMEPIQVKSKWIDQIWYVPSPLDEHTGSIAITFIASKTGNKPPVLTPPWFRKQTFDSFKTASSKGRYYLSKIAIGNIGNSITDIAFSVLPLKFYDEVVYYQKIFQMTDAEARATIVANSNKWEEMFPEAKDLETKMRLGGSAGKLDIKINQIKTNYAQQNMETLKKAQAIQTSLRHKQHQIAQFQTTIKLIARGLRNPQELLKQTILTKVRNTVPYASTINNIIDIYKRKGANIKNIARTRTKKSFQQKVARWQKQSIKDNIANLNYQINKARLEKDPTKVQQIEQQIRHLQTKYVKIENRRPRRTRLGISSRKRR